jgi:3-phenylpropionate/trans-cinnamate dioxygenase ferredoxin reductase component
MSVLGSDTRVVIVGASLAGLRAAEHLRREGFPGPLTLVGDEQAEPYDRPPLSKQALLGRVPAERTRLPRAMDLGAEWLLGVPAVGLDRHRGVVRLADGREVGYERLLIATGVRNRAWPIAEQAALHGVVSLRTGADAARLVELLDAGPRRVLVIGGGFTGSEVASVCRQRDLAVTLVERGPAPLAGALGGVIGDVAADIQRAHGVDLRCGMTVDALEGDADGRLRQAVLSDGSRLDVDVAVVALGSVRNTEWLLDSRLAAGPMGIATDAGCRAIDVDGLVVDDVFAAGDVTRFPHPLYDYQFLALEHWENAVTQARVAAHNMVSPTMERLPHISVPTFWSIQFGLNIKSVGVPNYGEVIQFTQGSVAERSFVAAYGHQGRLVAAVTFDNAKWLDFYRGEIESAAPFPPDLHALDGPAVTAPVPAEFPHPWVPYDPPPVVLTGHALDEMRAKVIRPEGAPE